MGRGNQFSTHPGNVRFYSVIDDYTAAYFEAQTKFEKSRVVQQVFKSLSTSARFLRKDSTTKNFFLISDTDARQVCNLLWQIGYICSDTFLTSSVGCTYSSEDKSCDSLQTPE